MDTVKTANIIDELKKLKRNRKDNKRTAGRVLIFAGSFGMAGAGVMCVRGALRGGAGLVTCCTSRDIIPIIQISVPQGMCKDIEEAEAINLNEYDAIAFGSGFILDKNVDILRRILKEYRGKLVIDAEGLNIITQNNLFDSVKSSSADIVITPHIGEGARLIGEQISDREKALKALIEKIDASVLLKGNNTLVGNGQRIYKNETGNPALATGGSGDVLTGIIAAFMARGIDGFYAASGGAFVHGRAADLLAEEKCEIGMSTEDLTEKIPCVLKELLYS